MSKRKYAEPEYDSRAIRYLPGRFCASADAKVRYANGDSCAILTVFGPNRTTEAAKRDLPGLRRRAKAALKVLMGGEK